MQPTPALQCKRRFELWRLLCFELQNVHCLGQGCAATANAFCCGVGHVLSSWAAAQALLL